MAQRLLAIYLNDHLAGATVGVELVRRTARENAGTDLGAFSAIDCSPRSSRIVDPRAADAQLGIARSRPKIAAAWVVEKLGG